LKQEEREGRFSKKRKIFKKILGGVPLAKSSDNFISCAATMCPGILSHPVGNIHREQIWFWKLGSDSSLISWREGKGGDLKI